MTAITEQVLEQLGYNRFSWNNDAIIEWWKPLVRESSVKNGYRLFDYRLCVRFGEWRHVSFKVYMIYINMISLNHIQTIEQLEQLYNLLKEPNNDASNTAEPT